ncbi:hypothetical protein [Burkholderia thailandensis]|nr:hypothetical protein [Burkholderia thailandensis]MCS3399604.1 hypothetical protein [Burkholderia thailandensis]MCS6472154.1 hypothetical protein [Burkholderia thailandensis]MCS6479290.1 hypothetical protein [Burkholderia thailandensis]MCS6496931.1 hypothetical protein [Burkholderia thailandensis]MCS6502634.1 hypothetical protein [Burkholderia thailandensis]
MGLVELAALAGRAACVECVASGAAGPDASAIADAHAASAPHAARTMVERVSTVRRVLVVPSAAGPSAKAVTDARAVSAAAGTARRAALLRLRPVTARRSRSCRT